MLAVLDHPSLTLATGIPTSCKPDGHPSPSPREPHRRRNYAVRRRHRSDVQQHGVE